MVIAIAFVIAIVLIPPIVAAVAYQSGQAMFWPAMQALYTYFLPYTALAALGIALLFEITRAVINRLRKTGGTDSNDVTT